MLLTQNKKDNKTTSNQLDLGFGHRPEKDRNHHLGGRSFYFFDFDDNIAYLTTPIVIFHKESNKEKLLSSAAWAQHHRDVGKSGVYENYYINFDEDVGSFRYFRDQKLSLVDRLKRKKQIFVADVEEALKKADFAWKAPSWNCFYHATFNKRPMSVITARGHHPETIKAGIDLIVRQGHLPHTPNYLSVFPVSNIQVRRNELQDPQLKESVASLKKRAIRLSVEKALEVYGDNNPHRFGMSDDDPKNVELITEEMRELKRDYPDMSFFVIQTFEHSYNKMEIFENSTEYVEENSQLNLFHGLQ
jgi:hypothetical protein